MVWLPDMKKFDSLMTRSKFTFRRRY